MEIQGIHIFRIKINLCKMERVLNENPNLSHISSYPFNI
jgi:hypothetical protein